MLTSACEGLNFVSEIDSKVIPVFGPAPNSRSTADVLKAIGVSPTEGVSPADPDKFFSRLTAKKDWFDETQRENATRFKALKDLLENELQHLTVFRLGKIRITIYVLGIDREGKAAGVKMKAVET